MKNTTERNKIINLVWIWYPFASKHGSSLIWVLRPPDRPPSYKSFWNFCGTLQLILWEVSNLPNFQ